MEKRSFIRLTGFGMILMLMLIPVSPVLATGFEPPSPASATTVKAIERPDMTVVSSALCDVFGIECDRATMAKGVYIDPAVWEFSPQWMLIVLGSTKQRDGVLKFVDGLDASKEEKAACRSSLEALWEQYPVRAVKTEDGLALTIVPEKSDVRLAASENSALRELDEEIGRAMASSLDGEVGVQWAGKTHGGVIEAACAHNSIDEDSAKIVGGNASAPDGWYNDLPGLEQTLQRCYNHGYVPPAPLPPIPGVPEGFGKAPENCQKNATDATTAYYNNRLTEAFTSLGHSSHFMTDIGNPMHTGNLFVQGSLTVMGWNIHDAYERYADNNWDALGFNRTIYDTVETEVWGTPDYSTRLLGWKTQWFRDPLILLATLNFITHGGEFHLEEDPTICAITLWSLDETTKHTNGLVYYVIKDGIRTHVITATAGPHGSISPSGDVQVYYGEEQSFAITPDEGYTVDDVVVDGGSVGARTTYTFEGVESDHTIEATFKEYVAANEWIWSRDEWDGWSHDASWSGREVGPCSEYGPVIVDDHGEHGTDVNLLRGSTTARVERQFTDASGRGWNTLTFVGLLDASDVPGGRWMTIEVNGRQVFAGTASQVPPGNGRMFEISVPFPQLDAVNVSISHGQNPAWGPRFAMQYHSLSLTLDSSLRDADITDRRDAPFIMPDPDSLVTNATAGSP